MADNSGRKNVLLITYYWPPSGGVGVQRWLKHTKYLRDFGWEPIVYTAENADYPVIDENLQQEVAPGLTVLRQPIWEPYSFYKKFTGSKEQEVQSAFTETEEKPSFTKRLSFFIRSNFFIPDARMFWIGPSFRFLKKYIKEHQIDAIISNGTPHSVHMIALKLKKAFPDLPWIADFRDPWTGIDYFEQLKLTRWALHRHQRMEKQVMQTADKVVTVSWSWQHDFEAISGKKNVEVITNGYDETDFSSTPVLPDKQFTIYHTGVMGSDRNVPALWSALHYLAKNEQGFSDDLQLTLIGSVDSEVQYSLQQAGLMPFLDIVDFIPHKEVIRKIQGGQLLLLLINQSHDAKGRLPSKLYEYLGAKRPILAISPLKGDAQRILQETGAGELYLIDQEEEIRDYIRNCYRKFKANQLQVDSQAIEQFSRQKLAEKYADILNELV